MANEKRLIDANNPLKQLSDYMEKLHCLDDYRDGLYRGMEIAESYIKNAPTVDAVEVVHGHWISLTDCANAGVYCSVCHKKVWKEDYAWCNRKNKLRSNYCPNCGAKMDGGNEDGR